MARNRRFPPCLPCRSRKLACDRSQPTCNRCLRARRRINCVYSDSSALVTAASGQSRVSIPATERNIAESPPNVLRKHANDDAMNHGYFGNTSHNSLLEETQRNLFGAKRTLSPSSSARKRVPSPVAWGDLRPPLRESALYVLRCLRDHLDDQVSFPPPSRERQGWVHIAIDRILASLQVQFKQYLRGSESDLHILAGTLCNNTRQPVKDERCASSWIDQFCGSNLRWESMGLLWAASEHVSDDVDSLRNNPMDFVTKRRCPDTARACLTYSIELARAFTEGNDLLLDLCRRKAVLDSVLDGDSRIPSYASHGLAVTMLTYLGLHVLDNGYAYQPSFCAENQRRLAAQIFATDKFGVAFTGRPPLLPLGYCSMPLPLDLRDEDLASNEVTLSQAIESLDDRGWNTAGEVYPATLIRARHIVAAIRDELLGIALHKHNSVDIEQLRRIRTQQITAAASLPSGLIYREEDLDDPTLPPERLYFKITIQLDHLKNTFFVERLLHAHGPPDTPTDLLLTSFGLVRLTIELWKRRDSFSSPFMRRDFEWMLLEYGVPGGGILCQELLQSTYSGRSNSTALAPGLTPSAIVQQLSLLVAFLEWILRKTPTSASCASCKQLIERVLDHHLNVPAEAQGDYEVAAWTDLNWGSISPVHFGLELLNTFDWVGQEGSG